MGEKMVLVNGGTKGEHYTKAQAKKITFANMVQNFSYTNFIVFFLAFALADSIFHTPAHC